MIKFGFKTIALAAIGILSLSAAASADAPYGTIINKDGSMIALYTNDAKSSVVVARFRKDGTLDGPCVRESRAAWQARRAYIQAQSNFRAGYVPRRWPCGSV